MSEQLTPAELDRIEADVKQYQHLSDPLGWMSAQSLALVAALRAAWAKVETLADALVEVRRDAAQHHHYYLEDVADSALQAVVGSDAANRESGGDGGCGE